MIAEAEEGLVIPDAIPGNEIPMDREIPAVIEENAEVLIREPSGGAGRLWLRAGVAVGLLAVCVGGITKIRLRGGNTAYVKSGKVRV